MRSSSGARAEPVGDAFPGGLEGDPHGGTQEEALRRSEQRLSLFLEATSDGVWDWDVATDEVLWSERMFAMLGYDHSSTEVTRAFVRSIVHPDDTEKWRNALDLHLERGITYDLELRMRRADGIYSAFRSRGIALRDATGKPLRMAGSMSDLTEMHRQADALRESEAKFHKAFSASPGALSIAEAQTGEIIEVNEAYERISGISRDQVIGKTSVGLGIITAAERERVARTLAATGSVRHVEMQFRTAQGEARVGIASAELMDLGGRSCIILVLMDVTEQRRIEQARDQLEDQLRHMQKMEALGTLAGGIAHDFNNMLGAMLGFVEIAKLDASANPTVVESLNEVQRAGERATELVRQILTFGRRHGQERRPVQLQPVVEEAVKLMRSTLPSTIRFSVALSPSAERVHADPAQMHQVVVNLCTNAAHAVKGRPGTIELRLDALDARVEKNARVPDLRPGRYVELTVRDDGHGIDPQTQERIFEPFFTTKKLGEGTGLGLSVVHGIVNEHDGFIYVDSETGKGTEIHVLLPVWEEPIREDAARPALSPRGNGERILFVDDEPVLCAAARKLLGKLNYVVVAETNAVQALALFRADPTAFDLVITDLTMPTMTGVEVATELLRLRPGLPLIIATGFNANWTATAVRALGVHELVAKPLSAASLAQTIHRALHRRPT